MNECLMASATCFDTLFPQKRRPLLSKASHPMACTIRAFPLRSSPPCLILLNIFRLALVPSGQQKGNHGRLTMPYFTCSWSALCGVCI
jgi:hypothetical protein